MDFRETNDDDQFTVLPRIPYDLEVIRSICTAALEEDNLLCSWDMDDSTSISMGSLSGIHFLKNSKPRKSLPNQPTYPRYNEESQHSMFVDVLRSCKPKAKSINMNGARSANQLDDPNQNCHGESKNDEKSRRKVAVREIYLPAKYEFLNADPILSHTSNDFQLGIAIKPLNKARYSRPRVPFSSRHHQQPSQSQSSMSLQGSVPLSHQKTLYGEKAIHQKILEEIISGTVSKSSSDTAFDHQETLDFPLQIQPAVSIPSRLPQKPSLTDHNHISTSSTRLLQETKRIRNMSLMELDQLVSHAKKSRHAQRSKIGVEMSSRVPLPSQLFPIPHRLCDFSEALKNTDPKNRRRSMVSLSSTPRSSHVSELLRQPPRLSLPNHASLGRSFHSSPFR